MTAYRIEKDSLGEVRVPASATYGAQTERARQNFRISSLRFPAGFIASVVQIKRAAALTNQKLGLLAPEITAAIVQAADEIIAGSHQDQFPLDIFQTGSGTSTNMNVNEVIANLASQHRNTPVHPNDHVNMSQSSNDVIPSAILIAAVSSLNSSLLPEVRQLRQKILKKAEKLNGIVKTGRTHLMDALPLTIAQEMSGWASLLEADLERLEVSGKRLLGLPQGGTAIGTGLNAHPRFKELFSTELAAATGIPFHPAGNFFRALSSQDSAVELSGQLKNLAISLTKISNDLRWMNSGPLAGLAEIALPALQPGSSIMPGKVNPVIPEAVLMVAAQVIGNDSCITLAGQSGNFQLNVMLPLIAYNLLQSLEILAGACSHLGEKAILGFEVQQDNIERALSRNPILVTALNSRIGYDQAAAIAKQAYREGRPVLEVALECTDLSKTELESLLNPYHLTTGGIPGKV